MTLRREGILRWLREDDELALRELWSEADAVRRRCVGDDVHLRGLVEISSYCVRQCGYCGLRAGNRDLERYRMTREEILGCARKAARLGYGTVVLQAGEDRALHAKWVAELVASIKAETPLAVTLSLGERSEAELESWRLAGADRYLLRFETSDRALFEAIHPPRPEEVSDRVGLLRTLRELGYEVGSGVMLGIPGQSFESVAGDIELFRALDLDMIGVGPFIPHLATPLGDGSAPRLPPEEQVPNTEEMTYKVIALSRLVCPEANIPSTTALATLNKASGREKGLARGANVVMPNLTPTAYRAKYQIYPAKACIEETAEACNGCLKWRIASLGRKVCQGPGSRRHSSVMVEDLPTSARSA